MKHKFDTVILGGGCLGSACAFSLQRRLGKRAGKIAILEKKVLAAGLSSRHSAIVRSANASEMAASMAKLTTQYWKNLKSIWQVDIPFELPGAIWVADTQNDDRLQAWSALAETMLSNNIDFCQIDHQEAKKLTRGAINILPDETYFYEPDVLQLDSAQILQALQKAVKKNHVDLIEHCQVIDFETGADDRIVAVHTNQGKIYGERFVNAAGGWSGELFAPLGLTIPVALEPVYAANFLVSSQDVPENLPIIADFVQHAYFRRWRGSILHMHQPRSRKASDIAFSFSRSSMNPAGADVIYDASSFHINHQQLENYLQKVQFRFPSLGRPVFSGGFQSYFDITPDLKFILGPDHRITNLYHCLGGGQSLKYAPVFGEIIAGMLTDDLGESNGFDLEEFSIARFKDVSLKDLVNLQTKSSKAL